MRPAAKSRKPGCCPNFYFGPVNHFSNMNPVSQRIDYLDAVRGLAAFSVLMFHVIGSRWGHLNWALWFFNGGAAVAMFFVISGFVLSFRFFQSGTAMDAAAYKRFMVGRVFRIYPAFLVMLVVYYVRQHWSEQSVAFWVETFTGNPHRFWQEALLLRQEHGLFFPDWTLAYEVGISFFVPFMMILARHDGRLFRYLLLAIFIVGSHIIQVNFVVFGFGILLAAHFEAIKTFNDRSRWWFRYRWWLFPAVFFLFNFWHFISVISPAGPTFWYFTKNFVLLEGILVSGAAAAVMLLFVIRSRSIQRVLATAPFQFLGKISYGLYLAHWLVIAILQANGDVLVSRFGQNGWPFFAAYAGLTILGSTAIALVLYYAVELPFIRVGKKIAARIR